MTLAVNVDPAEAEPTTFDPEEMRTTLLAAAGMDPNSQADAGMTIGEREKQQRLGWGKWPAFVWAAITALRRYPFVSVRVTVDGKPVTTRTPFVFVGNNQYVMERLNVGTRESLDAGELSLYMARRTGRIGLVRLAIRALLGRLRDEKDFLAMSAQEVTVATKSTRARVAIDGEVGVERTPLQYRIRTRSLTVVVPASRGDRILLS
jgi:diacylglycerol kinase family enzyme